MRFFIHVFAGVLLILPAVSAAQTIQLQSGGCGACRIFVSRGPLIGTEEGPLALRAHPRQILQDRAGQYWLIPEARSDLPVVVDSVGAFRRVIGRVGKGPLELSGRLTAALRQDTVLIYDDAKRALLRARLDGELVSETRFVAGRVSGLLAPPGRPIITAANVRDSGRIGFPLHEYAVDGTYRRSFGTAVPSNRPASEAETHRILSMSRDGGIWVAHRSSYRIEKWIDGKLSNAFVRSTDWFEPREGVRESATITSVQERADGTLLVTTAVLAEDWEKHLGRPRSGPQGSISYPHADVSRMYRSYLDVIDVKSGAVLATQYMTGAVFGVNRDVLASFVYSPSGAPQVQLWRVHFRRSAPSPHATE